MNRSIFDKGLWLAVLGYTHNLVHPLGEETSKGESIQSAEEGIQDSFKVEIIDIHHSHGLACFPIVKKDRSPW